jgi:Fe-S cluster assembly iron-binding protein IscA
MVRISGNAQEELKALIARHGKPGQGVRVSIQGYG